MAKASYCVVVRDPADVRFEKVKSKHLTKRAAQRAASGKQHTSKVMRCPSGAKPEQRIRPIYWHKRRSWTP
jgi:hypothetical protein